MFAKLDVRKLQKCANIVDVEKCRNFCVFICKIGFDATENEPPKVFAKWSIDPPTPHVPAGEVVGANLLR